MDQFTKLQYSLDAAHKYHEEVREELARQIALAAERKVQLDAMVLQNGELRNVIQRLNDEGSEALKSANRLNGEYRKALESIAAVETARYPDGDAMSDSTLALIALGKNCGLCGSTLPCREHKEQPTEKREVSLQNNLCSHEGVPCRHCGEGA